jgi:predicted negative regulator of RcsB-dependent stress response
MDEEITIIDTKTRNEKIKNFFLHNKKKLISTLAFFILILLGVYSYKEYKNNNFKELSDKYNTAIIDYESGDKTKIILSLKEIVEEKDSTYSPLALYFLIDNELIKNKAEINELFDILINKTPLKDEIKNLIIYKKALFNADTINEKQLLDLLNPIFNSESVWKSHAMYLVAEYFYSKNEKQKSKEFFNKIFTIENANQDIKNEAQKRLSRDLSE